MLTMFIWICFGLAFALAFGVYVYRIRKGTFHQHIIEESGFLAILLLVNLTSKIPIAVWSVCWFVLFVTYLYGYMRRPAQQR